MNNRNTNKNIQWYINKDLLQTHIYLWVQIISFLKYDFVYVFIRSEKGEDPTDRLNRSCTTVTITQLPRSSFGKTPGSDVRKEDSTTKSLHTVVCISCVKCYDTPIPLKTFLRPVLPSYQKVRKLMMCLSRWSIVLGFRDCCKFWFDPLFQRRTWGFMVNYPVWWLTVFKTYLSRGPTLLLPL